MRLRWVSRIALLGALASPAAADPVDWTGAYVGLQAGGAWNEVTTDFGCSDGGLGFCAVAIPTGAEPAQVSSSLNGFLGGATAGYNLVSGGVLFGIETDISLSSIDARKNQVTSAPPLEPQSTTVNQELDWLGTVRGRVGLVNGDWLLFVTGGLAVGEVEYRYDLRSLASGDFARDRDSSVKVGWTAGAGLEHSFGGWSIKGEYLYYDLGDEGLNAQGIANNALFVGPTPIFHSSDFETNGHIVRAGVNIPLN